MKSVAYYRTEPSRCFGWVCLGVARYTMLNIHKCRIHGRPNVRSTGCRPPKKGGGAPGSELDDVPAIELWAGHPIEIRSSPPGDTSSVSGQGGSMVVAPHDLHVEVVGSQGALGEVGQGTRPWPARRMAGRSNLTYRRASEPQVPAECVPPGPHSR